MKKSNMLIAVFAVLAAASVAKAEEIKIDFDGGNKGLQPQSMHSIFAAAHNIVPAGTLKADAETNKRLLGGSGDPCCDDPTILCYAPCEPEQTRSAKPADFKALARYYLAQKKIKEAVSEYYYAAGDNAAAVRLADKGVRVAAGNGVVYLVRSGSQEQIFDAALAARVEAIVRPEGQQKFHPGLVIIGACMMDNDCWEAVGDGVSAISEWANS
jgi:hypothetical protein